MSKHAKVKAIVRGRDTRSGTFARIRQATLSPGRIVTVRVKLIPQRGPVITVGRDSRTGRFTTPRSADRIRSTSTRAADSLKRLAKR